MVWQMFEAERPHLVEYIGPFDGFHSIPTHSTIVLEPMANKVSYVKNLHRAVRQQQILGDLDSRRAVIPPFLTGCIRRTYAAIFSFCAGVMPPMPIFGRSLL